MLNNGNKKSCGFTDEIVAYIYDEIESSERTKFESHLVDCGICTDEFAGISNARFSVFEWQKTEFAPLPTPEIVIPYAAKQREVEHAVSVGMWAGIRGLFTLSGLPLTAAAALVICLGLGFLAMTYLGGNSKQDTANNMNEQSVPPVEQPVASVNNDTRDPVISKPSETGDPRVIRNSKELPAIRVNHPGNGIVANNRQPRQIRVETRKMGSDVAQQVPAAQPRKAPVLSNYDENDDGSLRLSDLVDDNGGGI